MYVSTSKHFKWRHSVIILGDSQWRGERLHVQFLSVFVTSSHKNGWTNSYPNLEIMFETVSLQGWMLQISITLFQSHPPRPLTLRLPIGKSQMKMLWTRATWSSNPKLQRQRLWSPALTVNDCFSWLLLMPQRALGEGQQGGADLRVVDGVPDQCVD